MTLKESLEKFGHNTVGDAIQTLTKMNKNVTGKLASSLSYTLINDDTAVDFDMEYYGYTVDQGRLIGKQPPIDAIEEWLKNRNLNTSLAYVIARSIGRKGIKPTYFFTDAFEKNNAIQTDELNNEVDFTSILGLTDANDIDDILKSLDEELKDIEIKRKSK